MNATIAENLIRVLTINAGSSSVKFALFAMASAEDLLFAGQVERIGLRGCRFRIADGHGRNLADEHVDLSDHVSAVKHLLAWMDNHRSTKRPDAVGHRIVHGGPNFHQPHLITPDLVGQLSDLVPLAPDHLPHEIKAIRAIHRLYPELPQVACFDTAFHRRMPRIAQIVPLPKDLREEGVIRYGFHGLSYEFILAELRKIASDAVAEGRLIVAHLGSGASMAAVRGGCPVDTTMGMTPAGGLVMSTRSGDLDPGIIVYLLEAKGMAPSVVNELINRRSGLLAVSGTTGDMKDLLAREASDPHSAEAVGLFCYQAKKTIGGFIAALGGLDTLVFTGGIGENAPAVRQRIVAGLDDLGIRLDPHRNVLSSGVISPDTSPVTVRVIKTDEELMIARHVCDALGDNLHEISETGRQRGVLY